MQFNGRDLLVGGLLGGLLVLLVVGLTGGTMMSGWDDASHMGQWGYGMGGGIWYAGMWLWMAIPLVVLVLVVWLVLRTEGARDRPE